MSVLTNEEAILRLEAGKKRRAALEERRVRANTVLEQRTAELASAQREARDQFGTDGLDALREELARRQAANAEAVVEFEQALADTETQLIAVERVLGIR